MFQRKSSNAKAFARPRVDCLGINEVETLKLLPELLSYETNATQSLATTALEFESGESVQPPRIAYTSNKRDKDVDP